MIRLFAIAAVLLAPGLVGAAPPAPQADSKPATAQGLDPNPLVSDSIGLTMHLPLGAAVQEKTIRTVPSIIATDGKSRPIWRLGIQPAIAVGEARNAAELAEEQIAQLKAVAPASEILDSKAVKYGGFDGWMFWVRNSTTDPEVEPMVSGWLAIPTGPGTFVTFVAAVTANQLEVAKPLLEASFATIQLKTIAEMNQSNRGPMEAGRALLDSFTPERLHAAVGEDQWYRLYEPAPNGEREIAIIHVETRQGKRGEVEGGRSEDRFKGVDHQLGLLVVVRSRFIGNADKGLYYDSEFRQWMAWNRSEECWSLLFTARQKDAATTEAITGIRTATPDDPDAPPARLTVIQSNSMTRSRDDTSWDVPDSYLSQAEHWLLGRLLPRDRNAPQEFGYYFFVNSKMEIERRMDRWESVTDGTAAWKLSTTMPGDDETGPDVSYFDAQGRLVRQVRANGAILVPISPERLREIWDRKGLKWSAEPVR